MTPGTEALAWYRRIAFRLALGLASLLLLAYVLFPHLHDLSLRLFGLPGIDQRLVRLEDGAPAPTGGDLQRIAEELLGDATHQGPGSWRPRPERSRAVEGLLNGSGRELAWLDADRRVVFASAGLPLEEGQVLDGDLGRDGAPVGPSRGGVDLGRVATGVWKEGEFAGWLLVYAGPVEGPGMRTGAGDDWPPGRGVLGASAPGPTPERAGPASGEALGSDREVLLGREEFDRTVRWSDRVLNAASILLFGAIALLLSFAVSRMVTRRITRLSNLASAPLDDPHDLPGPFDDTGNDEIASLARSMNAMRGRLIDLLGDMQHRDQARRRWIAQVSHDLRTPLTALISCLHRARQTLGNGKPEALREHLSVALLDADRLGVLTEDLLDIARLETDEPLVTEPVPPGELVRQAARAMAILADERGIELEATVAPQLPLLTADGRRLMRGLENLLRNALHHAESRVEVLATGVPGAVRFEVRDDGPGLPEPSGPEDDGAGSGAQEGATGGDDGVGGVPLEALARRLSRQNSAGLGLVVVRKVAEVHGGRTGARNLEDGGASVWFEIPA